MSARYAIYFAPPRHTPWWQFGANWLGRDEWQPEGQPVELPALPTLPTLQAIAAIPSLSTTAWTELTREPRRYGFHATLKAPFRLAQGTSEAALIGRVRALACTLNPVALGPLRVAMLGNFLALTPALPPAGLPMLANACVTELDDLRAPPATGQLARNNKHSTKHLDDRERQLLAQYGYPHVLDRFRWHMTLTGVLDPVLAQQLYSALTPTIAALNAAAPLLLDRLCLFVEAAPGAPFQRLLDIELPDVKSPLTARAPIGLPR